MVHQCQYRVSYADTDQMGVVYYGNYMTFLERARTEMLRDAGFPYGELEKRGWLLMVIEAHCKYMKPAFYDDLLTFHSKVSEIGHVKLKITTQIFRETTLLAEGYVVLGSVNHQKQIAKLDPQFVELCKTLRGDDK